MGNEAMWDTVAAERAALADSLAGITDEQWDTPSMCDEWTVRDVVAHMAASARITAGAFFPKLIGAGFSLRRMQAKDIQRERGASPAETLANLRSVVSSTKAPPGPKVTWLGETLIHGEDVRRPLGISHAVPVDAAVQVADFYKGSNLVIGAKKRIAGLRLSATDTDWSTGDGPEVSGPIVAVMLAMTGRKPALTDLTGEGVPTLRSRD